VLHSNAAQHSVAELHRDNAPEPRQRTTGQVVGLPLRGVRVFTCACGKVQAGSFLGSSLVPVEAALSHPAWLSTGEAVSRHTSG